MTEMYFYIRNYDGDTLVTALTVEQVREMLTEDEMTADDFLDDVPASDTNYWGECGLLIKGKVVKPRAVEMVLKYEVD